MLVLSRRKSERIFITSPDGVVLTVLTIDIRGDKARIGIDAPRDWMVHREEVYRQIEKEKLSHDCNA